MAKNSISKSGGSSRIRFIMVDAEIADGDLGPITQAIQNAIRGPSPTVQRISALGGGKIIIPDATDQLDAEDEVEQAPIAEVASRASKPKGPRKVAATPEVLDGIDWNAEPSLASFAKKANPESDRKRYLVIAYWFKQHRNVNNISPAHIYTAYRHLKWPSSISDFGSALRSLKFEQLMTSPERGLYAINHLGLSEVDAMIGGAE